MHVVAGKTTRQFWGYKWTTVSKGQKGYVYAIGQDDDQDAELKIRWCSKGIDLYHDVGSKTFKNLKIAEYPYAKAEKTFREGQLVVYAPDPKTALACGLNCPINEICKEPNCNGDHKRKGFTPARRRRSNAQPAHCQGCGGVWTNSLAITMAKDLSIPANALGKVTRVEHDEWMTITWLRPPHETKDGTVPATECQVTFENKDNGWRQIEQFNFEVHKDVLEKVYGDRRHVKGIVDNLERGCVDKIYWDVWKNSRDYEGWVRKQNS